MSVLGRFLVDDAWELINISTLIFRLVLAFFSTILLSSCAGQAGDVLTLTFTPQGCSYEAAAVLEPIFTVNWYIEDDITQEYVYILLTLDKGKTKSDLEAWLAESIEHPSWANILTYNIFGEGGQMITKQHDLSASASYDGSPVYIICSIGEKLLVEGPVKIKD